MICTKFQKVLFLAFYSKLTDFIVTCVAAQSKSWEVMNTVYSGSIYTLQKVVEKMQSTTLSVMKKLPASCFCGRLVESTRNINPKRCNACWIRCLFQLLRYLSNQTISHSASITPCHKAAPEWMKQQHTHSNPLQVWAKTTPHTHPKCLSSPAELLFFSFYFFAQQKLSLVLCLPFPDTWLTFIYLFPPINHFSSVTTCISTKQRLVNM